MKTLCRLLAIALFVVIKVAIILVSPLVALYAVAGGPLPRLWRAEGVSPGSEQDTLSNHFLRNPAGGMASWFKQPGHANVTQRGEIVEPILATSPWLQTRWRHSGWLASFRIVVRWCPWFYWDCYHGWKMDGAEDREQTTHMDFAFSDGSPFRRLGR